MMDEGAWLERVAVRTCARAPLHRRAEPRVSWWAGGLRVDGAGRGRWGADTGAGTGVRWWAAGVAPRGRAPAPAARAADFFVARSTLTFAVPLLRVRLFRAAQTLVVTWPVPGFFSEPRQIFLCRFRCDHANFPEIFGS